MNERGWKSKRKGKEMREMGVMIRDEERWRRREGSRKKRDSGKRRDGTGRDGTRECEMQT